MEDNYIKSIGETLQDKINLLQEELFKEKEKNKELDKFIKEGITIKPNNPYKNFQLNYLRENFIPKSKVEKLIEEFKPDSKETFIYNQENFIKLVEALQFLLGKE